MKRKPTNRSTSVYDFNESDEEPFTAKRKNFFDAFSKGKECSKGRGKNDGSMCEDRTRRLTRSMRCGKLIAKETSANSSVNANEVVWGKNDGVNCKDLTQSPIKSMGCGKVVTKEMNVNMSSPASDTIQTDDSDSDSNQARRQLDMRFGGAPRVSSAGIFKDEDFMAEENRKVVMDGEELWLFDEKYSFPEFSFTADAIEVKTQAFGVFKLPLLEIKAFRSGSYEKGLSVIELDLTEHGGRSLQEHLGHPDSYKLCHIISGTFLDHSSYIEKIRQITCLSDGYKSIYRHGKEYVRRHTENSLNSIRKDRDNAEFKENECLLNDCIVHRNRASLNDWSDLIYPTEDDRDAVTVTRYDYSLLEPDQFLSDTIIDFYIKYIQSKIPEADKKRFYFYNSFFFRKLTEVDKHLQTSLEKSKSSFERVKRWTAGINIFDRSYLFLPIMQNAHWSLVIICDPGYLSSGCSDEIDFKAPVILHLDSLEGCHTCIEEPIRSYLMEAWRERNDHNGDFESLPTSKFVTLKVPQQTNYSDCGLFLLHYVELFIAEVLRKDSTKFFASYDWFNPADASRKRAHIRSLVQDLKANNSARDNRITVSCKVTNL